MGTQQQHSESLIGNQMPFLLRLRDWVFGNEKPDMYTQASFYMNLFIWFIFFLWSIASYVAITFRQMIFEQKNIPVELIIKARGIKLGFEPTDFLDRLLTFHAISIICWIAVFIGLVLMWRKDIRFIYFHFGGTLFYFGMLLFYLSFSYYKEDTTFFDKVTFLAMNVNAVMYYLLLRREINGSSLSFFGEEDDEE